jgi:hypothetical protein
VESAASASFDPPPAARQNTAEMHDSEVNPPAGGSVVTGRDHPTVGTTGVGMVVGTADGNVVVVVVDVVGVATVVGTARRTGVAAVSEHPAATAAATTATTRAGRPALPRAMVTAPPTRSDPRTAGQG